MILCTACGWRNDDHETFCARCQAFLEWEGEVVEPPPTPEPEPDPDPEPEPEPTEELRTRFVDRVVDRLQRSPDAPATEPDPAGDTPPPPSADPESAPPAPPSVDPRSAPPPPPPVDPEAGRTAATDEDRTPPATERGTAEAEAARDADQARHQQDRAAADGGRDAAAADRGRDAAAAEDDARAEAARRAQQAASLVAKPRSPTQPRPPAPPATPEPPATPTDPPTPTPPGPPATPPDRSPDAGTSPPDDRAASDARDPSPATPPAVPAVRPTRPTPRRTPRQQPVPDRRPRPGERICASCETSNPPERRFCRRCGHTMVDAAPADEPATRPPWWRRIFRREPTPHQAGDRPMRRGAGGAKDKARGAGRAARGARRTFLRVARVVAVLAVVAGVIGLSMESPREAVTGWAGDVIDSIRQVVSPQFEPITARAVEATSENPEHPARNVIDRTDTTWWATDGGDGLGERLFFTLDPPADVAVIGVIPGAADPAEYAAQPRPQTLEVFFDTGGTHTLEIQDDPEFQAFRIDVEEGVRRIEVQITAVHPGQTGSDLSITQIEFQTRR